MKSLVKDAGMKPRSLATAIAHAGSPMNLLWKPNAPLWTVPVIEPEYIGWAAEQAAWRDNVAIMDLSHHMNDLWIEGPDALQLLMDYSANNYDNFVIGQAKQFVPVTSQGHLVTDGILMRETPERFNLVGVPAAQSFIQYHGEAGGYDAGFTQDKDSGLRGGGDPMLFRYQVQGPQAIALVEALFGGPLPKTKFFHSSQVSLGGRNFRAFRHGMAGMPGYEFIGAWEHAAFVKDAIMRTGEQFGLVHIGGMAYYTNTVESGWVPTPTPGIFTDPALAGYRDWLSEYSYEGKKPLHGSFYSPDIADYYCSPFELGYGKSIAFNHDFLGRDALAAAKDGFARRKVTIVVDPADAAALLGTPMGYLNSQGRYRIEIGGRMVGITFHTCSIAPQGTIIALALVDAEVAQPGTLVKLIWGEHDGPNAGNDPEGSFRELRARIAVSPYDEHARTTYRKD
jgi:vanillate/3-O-methylgallate O-demethylase